MKKTKVINVIITVCFLISLISINAFAAKPTTTKKQATTKKPTTTQATTKVNSTTAPQTTAPAETTTAPELGGAGDKENENSATIGFIDKLVGLLVIIPRTIENLITQPDTYGFINVTTIVTTLNKIFLPIGYSVFFICWLIGVGKKSIELELYEAKGFLKQFSLLFIGLIFLGISTTILNWINGISQQLTAQVISTGKGATIAVAMQNIYEETYRNYGDFKSTGFITGFLNQFFSYLSHAGLWLIFSVIFIFVFLIIAIVLSIRIIKLAIFQGVAPIFFGFMGSQSTQRYTQNFIVEYCKIALQIVLISITLYAFESSFVNYLTSSEALNNNMVYAIISMVAFAVIIVTSDKIFDRVLS
ncbi:MAG: type IV secretion system protein [Oscillospiraceae bacterium]